MISFERISVIQLSFMPGNMRNLKLLSPWSNFKFMTFKTAVLQFYN